MGGREDGDDDDENRHGRKKKSDDPYENVLLWIPASIMRQVHPGLVEEYEQKRSGKQAKKAPR